MTAPSAALLDELNRLANVGQLAGPLAHEFNNFLNLLLLNVAVLEKQIPERFRPDLVEVRRQGNEFARLVKEFQRLRHHRPGGFAPAELAPLVRAAVEGLIAPDGEGPQRAALRLGDGGEGVSLNLQMESGLPAVALSPAEFTHLVTYLVKNAAAAADRPGGKVGLRMSAADGTVHLRVEDNGPGVSPDLLGRLFEASTAGRPGTSGLELAACRSIARRLNGTIKAENLPGGGLAVAVSFPVNQELQ